MVLLTVLLLGAGACADEGTLRSSDGTSSTTEAPAPAPSDDPPAAGGGPAAPQGSPATTRRASPAPPTSGAAGSPTTRGGDRKGTGSDDVAAGDLQPPPGDDGASGSPGAFARTILRPRPATAIIVERYAQQGADVAASSIERSGRILGEVSGKAVDIRPPIAMAGGARDWTAQELRDAADRLARTPQGGGRAVLRLLCVRGTFQGSDEVLGAAVRGDVIAVFRDNISGASTPVISGRTIEDAVLLHEFGHLMGLVDLVLQTGRADPDHPGHSRNRDSVMYWAVESSLVTQVLGGGPPRDFDAADLADLRALRDGA